MSNVKCGLALVGGYVLGRTRKAKAAISLGLWLSGRNYHPKDLLRDQLVRLTHSAEGEKLAGQLRGPAAEAGRRAVVAVYESQLDRLSGVLAEHTERLTAALGDSEKLVRDGAEAAGQGAEAVGEGAGTAAETAGKTFGDAGKTFGGIAGSVAQGSRDDHDGQRADESEREGEGEGQQEPGAERRFPGRSAGSRQDTRRGPLEHAAQGASAGGSR
ncbi:hypothetical protein UG55_103857 [Frankia sp. EI5c]|uniref:hypothetical protein n=1 Tax=Frankia sp. EI5c TaxID=683316 RepID=UPI0007C232B8|nr:hypothetical protein [Frankia sp. EI5c]OAA23360.1 hypothetical protein UG55_103857 [Frankia sp. EI5c]